jgi:hypothetical protein
MEEVGTLAKNSRVEFHVAHIAEDAAGGAPEVTADLAGIETLSGLSGHDLMRLRGDTAPLMAKLAADTAITYQIAFEPEPGERNGGFHKVDIGVLKAGIKPDFWPRMTIARPGRPPAKNAKDMLRLTVAERDLALRAAAFAARGQEAGKVQVIALFEPVSTSAKLASAMAALLDGNGQAVVHVNVQSNLNARPVMCSLPVRPGKYLLRIAAIDTAGRAGTVDYEVNAGLTSAGPLQLSAMAFGVAEKNSFAPRLEFSTERVAVAHFEVYGAPKGQTVSTVLEMAESMDGPAVATVNATVSDQDKDVQRVYGSIPLPNMSGQILVRAIVSIDGKPVGKLLRTLSKNIG